MITSPFSKTQIAEAEKLENEVFQISDNHFMVKKYKVSRMQNRPLMRQWNCDCKWATYRKESKYCKHIIAVWLQLIRTGRAEPYWLKAIYGCDE